TFHDLGRVRAGLEDQTGGIDAILPTIGQERRRLGDEVQRVLVDQIPALVVGRQGGEFVGTCGTVDIDIDLVTDPRTELFGERAVEHDLVHGRGFDTLLYPHRGELGTGPGVAELGPLFLV